MDRERLGGEQQQAQGRPWGESTAQGQQSLDDRTTQQGLASGGQYSNYIQGIQRQIQALQQALMQIQQRF